MQVHLLLTHIATLYAHTYISMCTYVHLMVCMYMLYSTSNHNLSSEPVLSISTMGLPTVLKVYIEYYTRSCGTWWSVYTGSQLGRLMPTHHCSTFLFLPVKKLSATMTSCPSFISRSTKCEPTNPLPPVT